MGVTRTPVRGIPVKQGSPPFNPLPASALRYFRHFVDSADDGHFLVTDVPVLEHYCLLLAQLDSKRDEFVNAELTVPDRFGTERTNPEITSFLKMQQAALSIGQRLRLQPSMRAVTDAEKSGEFGGDDGEGPSAPSQRSHLLFGGARAAAMYDEADE
jgi:phage terminase small subunit